MALQIYDTKDAIPEAWREHYVERDGKWYPDVPAYEADRAKLGEFRENNRKLFGQVEEAQRQLTAFQAAGGDPVKIKQMQTELEELKRKSAGVDDEKVEAEIKRRLGPLQSELSAKEQAIQAPLLKAKEEITGLSATIEELVIDRHIRDIVAMHPELGVQPTAISDALPIARRHFRVEKGADGSYVPVAYEKTGTGDDVKRFSSRRTNEPYDGRDFLLDHRETRPHWFASEGGGATGGKPSVLRGNVLEVSNGLIRADPEKVGSGEIEVRVGG